MSKDIISQENVDSPKGIVAMGKSGLQLQTMEDLFRFSKAVVASGFAPRGMEKVESIFVAVQLGLELGITPMAALQNIAVINGRPGIYGDAALALVRSSGLLEDYSEEIIGKGEQAKAVVSSKRKGTSKAITTEFSVEDARRAELWGKSGPWKQYPERMLKWRARGFNLRDNFGDVLKGLKTTEELSDSPINEQERFAAAKPIFDEAKEVSTTPKVVKESALPEPEKKQEEVSEPEMTYKERFLATLKANGIAELEFEKFLKSKNTISSAGSIHSVSENIAKKLVDNFNDLLTEFKGGAQ